MTKFTVKVEHEVAPMRLEWFFLAKEESGEVALVESVIGLYNKGFVLFDIAQEAIQLAKDLGYPKIKLITFANNPIGKPYLESELV